MDYKTKKIVLDGLNLTIRKVVLEDIDKMKKTEEKSFNNGMKENFEYVISNDGSYIYLAMFDNDDNVITYAGASISYESADILALTTVPELRRRGLAYLMMQELISILEERGVVRFFIEVNEHNTPAIKLYEKLGFEELSIRKNYYGKDDAIVMQLLI